MKRIWSLILLVGCSSEANRSFTQQLCDQDGDEGCCPGSPIIVDMAGDGVHLTSAKDGVVFMLRPGGFGQWAWTEPGSDDAFLVLDVNDNGRIEDGAELFGDGSIQVANGAPNGFNALAYYDWEEQGGNGDGVIDARDKVWSRLQLWRDADHDAYSAPYELTGLAQAGVHAFSLAINAASHFDRHGNETRFTATIDADAPVSPIVQDVWLVQAPVPSDSGGEYEGGTLRDYTEWTCWSWSYAVQWNQLNSACDNQFVQNDPLIIRGMGFTRLIARFSRGRDKALSKSRARTLVLNARESCVQVLFPSPDTYYPPPYDAAGDDLFEPRIKCFSRLVVEGGGGGCH